MADYNGTATGAQLDALPGQVSDLQSNLSDLEDVLDGVVSDLLTFYMADQLRRTGNVICVCESGMTFQEWLDSDYNTLVTIKDDDTFSVEDHYLTDTIEEGEQYGYYHIKGDQ